MHLYRLTRRARSFTLLATFARLSLSTVSLLLTPHGIIGYYQLLFYTSKTSALLNLPRWLASPSYPQASLSRPPSMLRPCPKNVLRRSLQTLPRNGLLLASVMHSVPGHAMADSLLRRPRLVARANVRPSLKQPSLRFLLPARTATSKTRLTT